MSFALASLEPPRLQKQYGKELLLHACDKGVILALPLGQYPFMDTARQVAPITRNTCNYRVGE